MKHYICVEEHEVTYACGTYKVPHRNRISGTVMLQESECVKSDGDISVIFKQLSDRYHLEGRKVTLVLGRDVAVYKVKLPKAGERALRRMARNEVAAAGKCRVDSPAAVDIQRNAGGLQIPAMVYYMGKKRLDMYSRAMELAGMVCERTLLLPDCVAAASHMMGRNSARIVVDVEKKGMNLYGVSGGHCLAFKSSPLKAGRFMEMGAQELLYEEIAEQAGLMQKQMKADSGKCAPECIVLAGNCFPGKEYAAAYLEEHLRLPCAEVGLHISSQKELGDIRPGALAAIVAGSRPRLLELHADKENRKDGFVKGVTAAISKGCALFLAVNILAAAGVYGYIEVLRHQISTEITALKTVMDDTAYREEYEKLSRMDSEIEEKAALRSAERIVREKTGGNLDMKAFHAFTGALELGMKIESVVYEADPDVLDLVISMDNSGQVPAYVERVAESGVFGRVSHGLWEKREEQGEVRVYASVRFFLKEGGRDEIK